MHLKKETLYYYLKDELAAGEKEAVKLHLDSCADCAKSLEAAQKLWTLFGQGLQEAPILDLSRPVRQRTTLRPFVLKPAFAAGFAAVIVISGLIIGRIFFHEDSGKKVSNFVYNTYSTVYDFDYYSRNYIDGSNTLYTER